MADRYLVPRRLDDPELIGFWTIDEFAGLLVPFAWGTQWFRFAPDPQRCCRGFAHRGWLELILGRRTREKPGHLETFAGQSGKHALLIAARKTMKENSLSAERHAERRSAVFVCGAAGHPLCA